MARYDYRCPACGNQFEVEHPMSEHPQVMCPECGSEAQQVFGASSIVFKGSGFYNTDQRGSKGATSGTSGTPSSAKPETPAKKAEKSSSSSSATSSSEAKKSE